MTRAESLRQLRLAVKRDLEWLLNTTRMPIEVPETCEEMHELRAVLRPSGYRQHLARRTPATNRRLLRSLENGHRDRSNPAWRAPG